MAPTTPRTESTHLLGGSGSPRALPRSQSPPRTGRAARFPESPHAWLMIEPTRCQVPASPQEGPWLTGPLAFAARPSSPESSRCRPCAALPPLRAGRRAFGNGCPPRGRFGLYSTHFGSRSTTCTATTLRRRIAEEGCIRSFSARCPPPAEQLPWSCFASRNSFSEIAGPASGRLATPL